MRSRLTVLHKEAIGLAMRGGNRPRRARRPAGLTTLGERLASPMRQGPVPLFFFFLMWDLGQCGHQNLLFYTWMLRPKLIFIIFNFYSKFLFSFVIPQIPYFLNKKNPNLVPVLCRHWWVSTIPDPALHFSSDTVVDSSSKLCFGCSWCFCEDCSELNTFVVDTIIRSSL